jgi:hypothetical protein
MSALNLAAFAETPLEREPYDFMILPGFLKREALPAIMADFPMVQSHGSFPVESLKAGPAFTAAMDELRSPETAAAFGAKFGMDLSDKPTMITVRGRTDLRDGGIHTDSRTKLITVLIYMNPSWAEDGGRLRILRNGTDLENYVAEVPPDAGTLLAFRRSENSWHGHRPFVGERRAIQLNWVVDDSVVRREQRRHRLSALWKRLVPVH